MRKGKEKTVYRKWWMNTFLDLFICGAGLFVMATIILISIPNHLSEVQIGHIVAAPIVSYIFIMIAGLGVQALKYRLEIDDNGIMSTCWGTVYSSWENLSHFGYAWFGKNRFIGIITKQPTHFTQDWYENMGASHLDFTHFVPISHVTYPQKKHFLSQEYDWDAFARTEIGQDLLHYAPQLFKEKHL